MRIQQAITIHTAPEVVWSILADVEGWPQWTDSMTSIRLQDNAFEVGARVSVVQPRLPDAVWTVTRLEAGRRFDWATSSAGVSTSASHLVEPTEEGSRASIRLEQSGVLSPLVSLMLGKLTRRYVEMELAGLKQRAESAR